MIQAEDSFVLEIFQSIERLENVGIGFMILVDIGISHLDACDEAVGYELSHVEGGIEVIAHVVEFSDIHHVIFAVGEFGF